MWPSIAAVVHSIPTIVAPHGTVPATMDRMLIVLSGRPASGKTALAAWVARELRATLLSVDPIDSALATAGVRETGHVGVAAYAVAGAIAEQNLVLGATVVVDAVNAVGEAKTFWIDLARRSGSRLLAVEAIVSDEAVHRIRLHERVRDLAIAEPTWEAVVQRRDEWVAWPFAALVIDAVDPLEANVGRVLEAARTIIAERPEDARLADVVDNETPEGTPGP